MNKPFRILVLAVVLALLVGACALWSGHSRSRDALTKYKAELRARGEKLSWADMGYPRPPLTNDSLPQLLAAANDLGQLNFQPGQLALMNLTGPGWAESCWSGPEPRFSTDTSAARAARAARSWPEFVAVLQRAEPELAKIRAGLVEPPRYFEIAPTNVFTMMRNPFVQKRAIAQWLSGDLVGALHEGQLGRAQVDLHALIGLIQLHRDEPTLVNQMIRVAITGLALSDTWEALCAKGWTEESLAALQRDWESVNLMETTELAAVCERTFGVEAMALLRSVDSNQRWNWMRMSSASPQKTARDYWNEWVMMPIWRLNADTDELFFLQHHQSCLDSVRKLRTGSPWPSVNGELNGQFAKLNQLFGNRLAAIRYQFSASGIPNTQRATQTTVRNEMLRRMAVTVIALERYKLRRGQYPTELSMLDSEFLGNVPVDLMNNQPLSYRFNADGTFTLYSVGEDGRDDGGDATSSTVTNKFNLWSGRDAVWPRAAGKQD